LHWQCTKLLWEVLQQYIQTGDAFYTGEYIKWIFSLLSYIFSTFSTRSHYFFPNPRLAHLYFTATWNKCIVNCIAAFMLCHFRFEPAICTTVVGGRWERPAPIESNSKRLAKSFYKDKYDYFVKKSSNRVFIFWVFSLHSGFLVVRVDFRFGFHHIFLDCFYFRD
jgi:hypothetical protein